jgi:hypothetical protein
MLAPLALALDSSRLADEFTRTDFTVEDDLPDNVVNANRENCEWVPLGGHAIRPGEIRRTRFYVDRSQDRGQTLAGT